MKIRGYQLRFIKTHPTYLTTGMYVSLNGILPIGEYPMEPHRGGTPNLGLILQVIEDKRLGTIYKVKEDETGEIHKYIEDKLCSIAPVLVSDDKITSKCIFYVDSGRMEQCEFPEGNEDKNYVINTQGEPFHKSTVKRIVARSHEIAYVVNDGPPHDRNQTWKTIDGKLLYLEVLHPDIISRLVYYGSNVRVLVGDDDKPLFFEGKIVIDAYGLYNGK